MEVKQTDYLHHWNYFLALDDDLVRLSRYIEISKDNFNSYSLEFARILFSASSEIDVVGKMICKKITENNKVDNINEYRKNIVARHPEISITYARIPRYGLVMQPWDDWDKGINPQWWSAYNNVKHHRHSHFNEASLENALYSVAGLFVLLLFMYQEEAEQGYLNPDPRLLQIGEPFVAERNLYEPYSNCYLLNKE